MLVLARKEGQTIELPAVGTSIRVMRIQGNAVRIGVQAPEEVKVYREELLQRDREAGLPLPANLIAENRRLKELVRFAHSTVTAAQQLLVEEEPARARELLHGAQERLRRETAVVDDTAPKALVVEDDPVQREVLAELLRSQGFEVQTAADGDEALRCLRRRRPDLLLMDMVMPRCDGPTAIQAIRRDPQLSDLHIIAVSGASREDLGVSHGPGGVDLWLEKPVDPCRLIRELSRRRQEDPRVNA